MFEHALPKTSWHTDILTPIWHKLAINCIINPLTAIDQVKNGELSSPKYQEVITLLINEISQVLNAEGLSITREKLITTVHQVIEATSDNYSSMHQDIFHKRPSEIDFITGYLLQRAKHIISLRPSTKRSFKKLSRLNKTMTKTGTYSSRYRRDGSHHYHRHDGGAGYQTVIASADFEGQLTMGVARRNINRRVQTGRYCRR